LEFAIISLTKEGIDWRIGGLQDDEDYSCYI